MSDYAHFSFVSKEALVCISGVECGQRLFRNFLSKARVGKVKRRREVSQAQNHESLIASSSSRAINITPFFPCNELRVTPTIAELGDVVSRGVDSRARMGK